MDSGFILHQDSARVVRVRDLPRDAPKAFLHCGYCMAEFSADPRDYFAAHPDSALLCDSCGRPLRAVTKQVKYLEVAL